MKRQVILLEDLIDVFGEELGHVLEDVDSPEPGRPPIYPAKSMFLCWLFIYLGVADSQRRLIDFLNRHSEWRERQSIERVFSRLKSHFNLDNLRGRGLVRVKQHVLLSLIGMLVYALTAAKLGFESLVRSPTRLTA